MRTSFLHLADTRLGLRDASDPTVFERIAKQFRFAVDFAVEQRASFVVFSGDLFEGRDVAPDTLEMAMRGLSLLAEKNIAAIAIRGRGDLRPRADSGSWHDLLAQQGLLATLEVIPAANDVELRRWERRGGAGSYVDLGRTRVFGLHYYGAMTGPMLQALGKSMAAVDNREMDFRVLLAHAPLEHFSTTYGPRLSYADLLAARRQLDYVALGGCDERYEAEGWVYNPGVSGFFHVAVDTVVQPKHIARFVAYPPALIAPRPHPPVPRTGRREIEAAIIDELVVAGAAGDAEKAACADAVRLVTQSMWGAANSGDLRERLVQAAAHQGAKPADAA